MDLLIALVLGVCATLIVEELHAHSTSIARWLIRRAARRVPEGHRARFHEEWMAHLNDAGTVLRKLSHAMGCLYAAHDIAKSQRRVRDNIVAELTAIKWRIRWELLPRLAKDIAVGDFRRAWTKWSRVGMIDELIRVFQRHPQIIEKRTELRQELERILDVFLEL